VWALARWQMAEPSSSSSTSYLLLLLSLSLSLFLSPSLFLCLSSPAGKSLRMRAHVNHRALMWWLLPVTCQPYGRWHSSLSWYVTPSPVAHGCHTRTHTHMQTHAHLLSHSYTHRHAKTHVQFTSSGYWSVRAGREAPLNNPSARCLAPTHSQGALVRSCGPWRWSETQARFFFPPPVKSSSRGKLNHNQQ